MRMHQRRVSLHLQPAPDPTFLESFLPPARGCSLPRIDASGGRPLEPVMPFNLIVNRKSMRVEAPPDMPLLWVLRDLLDLKGAKYGCGLGQCGACVVHVDGVPQRSCMVPVSAATGMKITTIEGLSVDGSHPVQKAWVEMDVPQCGYCQAGQIMTAAAFLARNPRPTDAEIDAAMAANLCRCGTYLRIREAVRNAAETARSRPAAR